MHRLTKEERNLLVLISTTLDKGRYYILYDDLSDLDVSRIGIEKGWLSYSRGFLHRLNITDKAREDIKHIPRKGLNYSLEAIKDRLGELKPDNRVPGLVEWLMQDIVALHKLAFSNGGDYEEGPSSIADRRVPDTVPRDQAGDGPIH